MSTTPTNDSKNVLNSDVELQGTLRFSGELSFDGKLTGDIDSDGALTLGENAIVKGNINVNSVLMRGKVTGNVTAKDKIDIKTRAELFGDIRTARLAIEEGVIFVGQSEVNPNKLTPAAPSPARAGETGKSAGPGKPVLP